MTASLLMCQPAYAGLIVTDTFTEGSDVNLESHTADSGGAWDESTAGGIRVAEATDKAIGNAGAVRRATNATSIGTPDMVVEADISVSDGGATSSSAGIYAREASASTFGDHYLCALFDDVFGVGGSVDLALASRVGGADGVLDTGVNFNGTFGTVYHVRIQVSGSSVTCCVNHTECVSGTADEVTTGNYVGVRIFGTATQTIDNFKAYSYTRGKMTE